MDKAETLSGTPVTLMDKRLEDGQTETATRSIVNRNLLTLVDVLAYCLVHEVKGQTEEEPK